MENIKKYALVLTLNNVSKTKLLERTKKLELNCAFNLSPNIAMPHVSLMHFYASKPCSIISILNQEKNSIELFTHFFRELKYFNGGWYFLIPSSPTTFSYLHCKFFEILNPFFIQPMEHNFDKAKGLNQKERYFYTKYGYPYFEDCYNPHLTITRTKTRLQFSKQEYLSNDIEKIRNIELIFDSLTLAEVKNFGVLDMTKSTSFLLSQ
jgi:hypothetical protein